ncbi:DUF4870 domain-containing protein [uncultured Tessaracoccus sp.]|uniref:DUF4870 domain-containing protein n=1 Tax=uncultured Tessaracoccus sp. TaxID=905023 RepID=UPI00260B0BBA|nr:DUF4870 domain-containing protein [uncultured Tessaracoccus sp.]
MTEYDPYRDIDDSVPDADGLPQPDEASRSSTQRAKRTPQPVTNPVNPFNGSRYANGPSQADESPFYGAGGGNYYTGSFDNPFVAHHGTLPVPANRALAVPPERQAHLTMHKLNTWLSVFFPIASVVFFFVDKGKEPLYDQHLRETMNMGITRMILAAGAGLLTGSLSGYLALVSAVYFVLALLGALEAPAKYSRGEPMRYKGAIPFTRQDDN